MFKQGNETYEWTRIDKYGDNTCTYMDGYQQTTLKVEDTMRIYKHVEGIIMNDLDTFIVRKGKEVSATSRKKYHDKWLKQQKIWYIEFEGMVFSWFIWKFGMGRPELSFTQHSPRSLAREVSYRIYVTQHPFQSGIDSRDF